MNSQLSRATRTALAIVLLLGAQAIGAQEWSQVNGAARDVGVGANGTVWVIGTNPVQGGYGIYRWTGSGWAGIPGGATRIAVDPSGNALVVNNSNNIFRYTGSGWTLLDGAATDIGVGADGSLALVTASIAVALDFVPLETFGMSANFGPPVAWRVFLTVLPFALLGAALLTVVASFTKSYKEAQSWLGIAMLVPTVPIAIAGVLSVQPSAALMLVPSLSQHLVIQGLMRGDPVPAAWMLLSVASTLALGATLAWLAGRLYRREAILG
jgi:hypothetical protein